MGLTIKLLLRFHKHIIGNYEKFRSHCIAAGSTTQFKPKGSFSAASKTFKFYFLDHKISINKLLIIKI